MSTTLTPEQVCDLLHTQALMHIAIVEMGQRLNRVDCTLRGVASRLSRMETRMVVVANATGYGDLLVTSAKSALGHGDKINNLGVKK